MVKKIFLNMIKVYQLFFSPILGQNCRFYPSCSEYTYQAIEKHGIVKGLIMGAKRIFKCSQWNY